MSSTDTGSLSSNQRQVCRIGASVGEIVGTGGGDLRKLVSICWARTAASAASASRAWRAVRMARCCPIVSLRSKTRMDMWRRRFICDFSRSRSCQTAACPAASAMAWWKRSSDDEGRHVTLRVGTILDGQLGLHRRKIGAAMGQHPPGPFDRLADQPRRHPRRPRSCRYRYRAGAAPRPGRQAMNASRTADGTGRSARRCRSPTGAPRRQIPSQDPLMQPVMDLLGGRDGRAMRVASVIDPPPPVYTILPYK